MGSKLLEQAGIPPDVPDVDDDSRTVEVGDELERVRQRVHVRVARHHREDGLEHDDDPQLGGARGDLLEPPSTLCVGVARRERSQRSGQGDDAGRRECSRRLQHLELVVDLGLAHT